VFGQELTGIHVERSLHADRRAEKTRLRRVPKAQRGYKVFPGDPPAISYDQSSL